MTLTFKCNASGDVTMARADGDHLRQTIGKAPAAAGIIAVAAVPAAISALQNAVVRDSTTPRNRPPEDEVVELHQRIWPWMEMRKHARDEDEFVVWGV